MAYWNGLAATGYWNYASNAEPASGAAPALHIAARRVRQSAPAQAASVVDSVRAISPPKNRFGHLESTPAIPNPFRYGPYDYGRYGYMHAQPYGVRRFADISRAEVAATPIVRKSWMIAEASDMSGAQAKFNELDSNGNGFLEGDELVMLAEWVFDAFHAEGTMTDYQ